MGGWVTYPVQGGADGVGDVGGGVHFFPNVVNQVVHLVHVHGPAHGAHCLEGVGGWEVELIEEEETVRTRYCEVGLGWMGGFTFFPDVVHPPTHPSTHLP